MMSQRDRVFQEHNTSRGSFGKFNSPMSATVNGVAHTMFEKIWLKHRILERAHGQTLLYVDRHLIHEGSTNAFQFLSERSLSVRVPSSTFGSPDHYVPTDSRDATQISDAGCRRMVENLTRNTADAGITLFGLKDHRHGILHIVGPEQGISQPGMLIVCGDSHTSTHGAFGALAFGIGATEVAHVLASQCLWQRKPATMRITMGNRLGYGVTAKDMILAIIAKIGAAGANGHVIEYAGSAICELSMEGRLTVCNMSIEAGARAGMIAPDKVTFAYLRGRPYAPAGSEWEKAIELWRLLRSDPDAVFDREVVINAEQIEPMVTWGTSPQHALPIGDRVPDPAEIQEVSQREAMLRVLSYMNLRPGAALTDIKIDRVFIGSCTNSRIEDLRSAAALVKGRRVKGHVQAWVVPGSGLIKAQAEAEGLDRVFKEAGFQWREAGCSMCLGTNGEVVPPGERCASTSNRNFVGRQGPGARTHLMSPIMAGAAAITGHLIDVRQLMARNL
jgi:3-isopropylmalate/(R)-2-methylmalate dehydratase large subunit